MLTLVLRMLMLVVHYQSFETVGFNWVIHASNHTLHLLMACLFLLWQIVGISMVFIQAIDLAVEILQLIIIQISLKMVLLSVILWVLEFDIRILFIDIIVHFDRGDFRHLECNYFFHVEFERILQLLLCDGFDWNRCLKPLTFTLLWFSDLRFFLSVFTFLFLSRSLFYVVIIDIWNPICILVI